MKVWRPDSLPPLWWLNPWALVRDLHETACALKVLTDLDHDIMQKHLEVIRQQYARNRELEAGLDRLHAAIISGGAIVPDAEPEKEGADL